MTRFAVTAVGLDRPGIVAAVTGALAELDCNLEDTAMAILGGHFTMMMLVTAPADLTEGALERALSPAVADYHLELSVRAVDESAAADAAALSAGELWTINVRGADHPGIVHGVTSALAADGINILDLDTRVIDGDGGPVYVMVIDVTVPIGIDHDELTRRLDGIGNALGVTCSTYDASPDIF